MAGSSRDGFRTAPEPGPRRLTVDTARMPRWVTGYLSRHPGTTVSPIRDGFVLESEDGSWARVLSPVPLREAVSGGSGPMDPESVTRRLVDFVDEPHLVGVLLIRRGGYAAARMRSGSVLGSTVGRRRVHGRSSAGGWSQQRYARRRDNQTGSLLAAAVAGAREVLLGEGLPDLLVTGGDRELVRRALADPGLTSLADLPRGAHLPVADPRAAVLREVTKTVRSLQVVVSDRGATDKIGDRSASS
jgi:hypothetical protein